MDIISAGYGGATPADGQNFVDLIGGGIGVFPSGIQQSVHLSAGTQYEFSFWYNGGRYNDGSPTVGSVLEYSLGALVSGSVNVDALNVSPDNWPIVTPWQNLTTTVDVIADGDYLLKFSTPSGSWGGPYIDHVSLVVIPEPQRLLLAMSVGLLAVTAWRRSRRG